MTGMMRCVSEREGKKEETMSRGSVTVRFGEEFEHIPAIVGMPINKAREFLNSKMHFGILYNYRAIVNGKYVDFQRVLKDGDCLKFLPS